MREGRIADWVADEWLAALARKNLYLGLAAEDPYSVSDPLTVEVGGIAYSRPKVTWSNMGRVLRNVGAYTWMGMPAMTRIVAIVAFDAKFNGRMALSAPLPVPLDLPTGGNWTLQSNQLYIALDGIGGVTTTPQVPATAWAADVAGGQPYQLF